MRLKLNIQIIFIAVLLVGMSLMLWATGQNDSRESLEESCKKEESGGKMIWENLSNQFFSSF